MPKLWVAVGREFRVNACGVATEYVEYQAVRENEQDTSGLDTGADDRRYEALSTCGIFGD